MFGWMGSTVGPWVELVVVVGLAFAAAYLVQWFVVKPYRIPSESMENTLLVGDRVLVSRFWFRFSDPQRGQVIVFHPPGHGDEVVDKASTPANDLNFIKRVVGLPGEWVGGYKRQIWICPSEPPGRQRPAAGCRALKEPYTSSVQRRFSFQQVPAGPLLRDGRQPRQLRRLARHRHDSARLDPRPRVRDVLAAHAHRLTRLVAGLLQVAPRPADYHSAALSRLKELRANPIIDGIITIASAILIAYVVQLLIVKPYRIPSESMVPTLAIGDRVITARFLLRFRDPERGEVFVFHPNGKGSDVFQPAQGEESASSENYVKRVVGMPDETIGSLRGKVYTCKGDNTDTAIVNGELNSAQVRLPERAVRARADAPPPARAPPTCRPPTSPPSTT